MKVSVSTFISTSNSPTDQGPHCTGKTGKIEQKSYLGKHRRLGDVVKTYGKLREFCILKS